MGRKRSATSFAEVIHAPKRRLIAPKFQSYGSNLPKSSSINMPQLLQIIDQYGLLKSFVASITAKDLFNLAMTCKRAYQIIFPDETSRLNLTSVTKCDGAGIRIRNMKHQKSVYSKESSANEYATCGSEDRYRVVETKPCVSCGVNTCDECRIHIVYQSIHRPRDAEDELPYWSGFSLLHPLEMCIMSPEHLREEGAWDEPLNGVAKPHHDDGFLDMPMEPDDSLCYEDPESVQNFINIDLGQYKLRSKRPYSSHDQASNILGPFDQLAEARIRLVCENCCKKRNFHAETHRRPNEDHSCRCTLKSRLIDRWLCLKCYVQEEKSVRESKIGIKKSQEPIRCSCGEKVDIKDCVIMCLWCNGEVYDQDSDSTSSSPDRGRLGSLVQALRNTAR